MRREPDPVEAEYLAAMDRADCDTALELSVGLRQYREFYKAAE